VTQISRLNIKGSKQNNFSSDFSRIGLFEIDADDEHTIIEGKESPYRLHEVMGYVQKVHPLEIRVSGNNLNGRSIIQLVNSLLGYPYQLIRYNYVIDYNKLIDDQQYTGESLIFQDLTNK
jgi:hypothetical protein